MNSQHEVQGSLSPKVFGLRDWVYNLFPVPEGDAVGTNDLDNAITLLAFKEDRILYRQVKRDYISENSGDYEFHFMDVYSNEEIAYSQSRALLRVNLKRRTVAIYPIIKGLSGLIGHIECLDYSQRVFACSLLMPHGNNESRQIQVIKFEGDSFTVLNSMPAGFVSVGYDPPWRLHGGTIFIYDAETREITALDTGLNPTKHPFAEAFNDAGIEDDVREFVLHPQLPFALIYTEGLEAPPSLLLVRWDRPGRHEAVLPIFRRDESAFASYRPKHYYGLRLSPDGKWLVLTDDTDDHHPRFVAFPIDGRNPFFLGKPLMLGQVLREGAQPESSAWTSNPVSFVVTDGLALYKWDLSSVAQ